MTETVATVKPGVDNRGLEEQETSFKSQKEKVKMVPRGIRVPLRVEDEIWDGESIPKSRHSECEAEQLQVNKRPVEILDDRSFWTRKYEPMFAG